jgi:cell division protein FtsQ
MNETMERSRRSQRHRSLSRSRLRLLRYLLAAAAMLLAANVFFEISDIQVKGNMIYSEEEVVDASGLELGDSGLLTARPLVVRRIRRSLPGVSQASISLVLPDRMVISVEETSAVAVLQTSRGPILLSEECRVVGGFRGDEAELLRLRGLEPLETGEGELLQVKETDSTKFSYLREILPLVAEMGFRGQIQDMDISNVSNLQFSYLGRYTVRMGKQEGVSGKLDLMRRIAENLGIGDSGVLDMSTPQEGHYFPG